MLLPLISRLKSACFFLIFSTVCSLAFAQENSLPVIIQSGISNPLDDVEENQAGISIETTGGHHFHLNDSAKDITMSSTGSINIKAKGQISIQGAKIMLN